MKNDYDPCDMPFAKREYENDDLKIYSFLTPFIYERRNSR